MKTDDHEHEDEERRSEAGGGRLNDTDEQPGADKDKNRTPVFRAPAGAEQEFEQLFHGSPCICADKPRAPECVAMKRPGVQIPHSNGRVFGGTFAFNPCQGRERVAVHLLDVF